MVCCGLSWGVLTLRLRPCWMFVEGGWKGYCFGDERGFAGDVDRAREIAVDVGLH